MNSIRKFLAYPALAASAMILVQNANALSLGVGPIGGLNLGNAEVEDYDDIDNRMGVAAGLRLELGVTSPYSLLLEPTYIQKGARFQGDGVLADTDMEGDFDYLEIPLLLKAKFGAIKSHAYVFAGPSLGINLSAEGEMGVFGGVDVDVEPAPIVFSAEGGVGGAFQIAQYVFLSGDVRYSYGFTNALDEDAGDIESWNNRDIRFMLGVLFHITE